MGPLESSFISKAIKNRRGAHINNPITENMISKPLLIIKKV